jgi:DUF1365 family protein
MNGVYTGWVAHNRPGKHRLRYRVFMLALDLDELPRLNLALLGHNRVRLMSVFDRDHGERIDAPLKPQIEAKLRDAGIAWEGGRIVLLTMPRLGNYVFNPLSVYFCWRSNGELAALVHEVSNTFGERHFYVLPPIRAVGGAITQACAKRFFVSPFLEGGLAYEFRVIPPGDEVSVAIIVRRGRDVALTASFAGKRSALTDANLMRAWAGNPLMTLKVIVGIHWEALRMWLRGVRYVGRMAQYGPLASSPASVAGETPTVHKETAA